MIASGGDGSVGSGNQPCSKFFSLFLFTETLRVERRSGGGAASTRHTQPPESDLTHTTGAHSDSFCFGLLAEAPTNPGSDQLRLIDTVAVFGLNGDAYTT